MLVYANALRFESRLSDLLTLTAEWLSENVQQPWSARRLLEARTAQSSRAELAFRFVRQGQRSIWGMRMRTHATRVIGRVWQLEVMLRDDEQGGALATFVVYVYDDIQVGGRFPPPTLEAPEIVRRYLRDGNPLPTTPGLRLLPLLTREHAEDLCRLAADPRRANLLVVACPSNDTDDAERLQPLLTGLADYALLRAPTPVALASVLKEQRLLAYPGRAFILPAAAAYITAGMPSKRFAVGATPHGINNAVLKVTAPAVLKAHLSIEQLQDRGGPVEASGDYYASL